MIGIIVRRIREARLRSSARSLNEIAERLHSDSHVPHEIGWLELRRVTPAIIAGSYPPGLLAHLRDGSDPLGPNLSIVKGLLAVRDSAHSPEKDLAAAVCSIRMRSLIPRPARRELLKACALADWSWIPVELALAASGKAFALRRSLPLWRRFMQELARSDRWDEIRAQAGRHPVLLLRVRRAVKIGSGNEHGECIPIAELVAIARCRAGDAGRELARNWLLPLIAQSTGRYLERTYAAYWLSEQLAEPGHVTAEELGLAIESGILPLADNDYSNFRKAFSTATWELLHGALRNWAIFTELERVASEDNRIRYWSHIAKKGASR